MQHYEGVASRSPHVSCRPGLSGDRVPHATSRGGRGVPIVSGAGEGDAASWSVSAALCGVLLQEGWYEHVSHVCVYTYICICTVRVHAVADPGGAQEARAPPFFSVRFAARVRMNFVRMRTISGSRGLAMGPPFFQFLDPPLACTVHQHI